MRRMQSFSRPRNRRGSLSKGYRIHLLVLFSIRKGSEIVSRGRKRERRGGEKRVKRTIESFELFIQRELDRYVCDSEERRQHSSIESFRTFFSIDPDECISSMSVPRIGRVWSLSLHASEGGRDMSGTRTREEGRGRERCETYHESSFDDP